MDRCALCDGAIADSGPTVVLGQKGCEGIDKASIARESDLRTKVGQVVHVKCRRNYTDPSRIEGSRKRKAEEQCNVDRHSLRSASLFEYKTQCLFCGCSDPYDGKISDFNIIKARTVELRGTILQACEKYKSDWVDIVKPRVLFVADLPAADVVYHNQCMVNFITRKQVPKKMVGWQVGAQIQSKNLKLSGRPQSEVRRRAFLKVAEYLEDNDDEQISVNDLIDLMGSFLVEEDYEPYSFPFMKTELIKYFGGRIIIAEVHNKPNVVTFYSSVSKILHDFHTRGQKNPEEEKAEIIRTAALLIKNDIKAIKQPKDIYPSEEEMASSEAALKFVPDCLRLFLDNVLTCKNIDIKLASIGQAIVQASRPRVLMAPLQIGLGVQMHHHFQSKFLIESLHSHGFCCSYEEVKRYERCAAVTETLTNDEDHDHQTIVQYVADNVDHNVRTLDGNDTFHGMGIIGALTPRTKTEKKIRRINVTADDIAAVGRINVDRFIPDTDAFLSLKYEPLPDHTVEYPHPTVDFLWKISPALPMDRPLWSGFMQMIHKGDHPEPSSVLFLPMINLDPNDPTCIYSTLNFICNHAKRYKCTPVVTFDQPLWWKAHMIVEGQPQNSELHSVVVRLGGFHAEMSFLGSIGHLMKGSGLEDVLQVIYASNTVSHILSGKAVSRAVRGHFIVDAALHSLLAAKVLGIALPTGESEGQQPPQGNMVDFNGGDNVQDSLPSLTLVPQSQDIEELANLMQELLDGSTSIDEVKGNKILLKTMDKITVEKRNISSSMTASLWIQYMDTIDILRMFLKAERLGDWDLHLKSLQCMLPYLAASGHRLYLKSIHLYLQKMVHLSEQHPEVHKHFKNGLHVIRRSDRHWSGLSPDLVIEQCLMRSLKTTGGLTRGRGFSETQRLSWILSMPACAGINLSMQHLTRVKFSTSEQHKESSVSRISRDAKDTSSVIAYLSERSPFSSISSLRNIVTGVTAAPTVNVHESRKIGEQILCSMEGKQVASYTFRKKAQAITMNTMSTVKLKDEHVHVDPQLLFQRLVTVGVKNGELEKVFNYELCHYPPALFASADVLRPALKSSLADALWCPEAAQLPGPGDSVQYVLDGGALLHRIPWTKGSTYDQILGHYSAYVTSKYGKAVIVFDGYRDTPSTKDCTHTRRSRGIIGVPVHFSAGMVFQSKKEDFLCNQENKQRFIALLSETLAKAGCDIHQSRGDADSLIVQTAVKCASMQQTVLVGDDTDLLILLIHHARETRHNIFFRPEPKRLNEKSNRCWNINGLQTILGNTVTDNILFLHAILGCDTTSGVFGLGKKLPITKMQSNTHLQDIAKVFMSQGASKDDIISSGESALISLYNGNPRASIDVLRYEKFCVKAAMSSAPIQPATLPPPSSSLKYHSLRVYHQIQVWIGVEMPPVDWGWRVNSGKLLPVMTDLQPAPPRFLEVIRCGCKAGCFSHRCSCRKHGMSCSAACSECRGMCSNTPEDADINSDSEDDPC